MHCLICLVDELLKATEEVDLNIKSMDWELRMKHRHKRVSRSRRWQYSAELNQRLREQANQERRERLSQLKDWVGAKCGDIFVIVLIVFVVLLFLLVFGGAIFATVKYWSIFFSFLEKMVVRFGIYPVVGSLVLLLIVDYLLSLIAYIVRALLNK